MDIREGGVITLLADLPPGAVLPPGLDGAVVELARVDRRTVTAEIRIPGPPVP